MIVAADAWFTPPERPGRLFFDVLLFVSKRELCVQPPVRVKTTGASPVVVAVIVYTAGIVSAVKVTWALPPFPVVVDIGAMVPPVDVHVTTTPATGLPNLSTARTTSGIEAAGTTCCE